jgi:WD40 repeat protein
VIRTYNPNKLSVHALYFSPDGKFVTAIADNGAISIIAVSAADNELRGAGFTDVRALGPDHKTWLRPLKNEIHLWEVDFLDDNKSLPDQLDFGLRAHFKGHKDEITALAFALHDDSFASGSKDKTVIVWDRKKEAAKFTGEGHSDAITSLAFEDSGKYVASASKDGTVRLWDLTEKKKHQVLKAPEGAVLAVAFSLDGKLLATAGEDKVIRLWDVATGKTAMTLKGHTDVIKCLTFSRDGKYLASGGADKTVKLWEVK